MSDRKLVDALTELPLAVRHEMQIEALTKPGLTDEQRIEAFSDAAGFSTPDKNNALACLGLIRSVSPARVVWWLGEYQFSLFGNLPGGCFCPVGEQARCPTPELEGIPIDIEADWNPTVETLRRFAEVQQERRG